MLENLYSSFKSYWREVDKTIFVSFLILFILGVFFSFASTSTLAGERLNKDYYFFFFKTFNICFLLYIFNDFYILDSS
jgi:uncharacterized membrane protein